MILSAQRVRAHSGTEGINCYRYRQDLPATESPAEQLHQSGTLVWQHRTVPSPGNAVRSFIDIAAPEDVSWPELAEALGQLVQLQEMPQVFSAHNSRIAFHMNMEETLVPTWRDEALSLVSHLIEVHP